MYFENNINSKGHSNQSVFYSLVLCPLRDAKKLLLRHMMTYISPRAIL